MVERGRAKSYLVLYLSYLSFNSLWSLDPYIDVAEWMFLSELYSILFLFVLSPLQSLTIKSLSLLLPGSLICCSLFYNLHFITLTGASVSAWKDSKLQWMQLLVIHQIKLKQMYSSSILIFVVMQTWLICYFYGLVPEIRKSRIMNKPHCPNAFCILLFNIIFSHIRTLYVHCTYVVRTLYMYVVLTFVAE
jgi:hypothetical protein